MDIVEITGTELSELLRELRAIVREREGAVRTLRVAIDVDCVKFKVNGGIWSPGYGQRA
jgi:hypothetical protein